MNKNPNDSIAGKRVRVKSCAATVHDGNAECVCILLDRVVRLGEKSRLVPDAYEIGGGPHCVKREQIVVLPDHPTLRRRKK